MTPQHLATLARAVHADHARVPQLVAALQLPPHTWLEPESLEHECADLFFDIPNMAGGAPTRYCARVTFTGTVDQFRL